MLVPLATGPSLVAQAPIDPFTYIDLSVFSRGVGGNLAMYHFDIPTQTWSAANLSANLGASYRIVGDPSPVVWLPGGTGGGYARPDVFARNDSGELLDFFWTPTYGWQARNRTNETGGGRFTGNPVAVVAHPYERWAVLHVFGRGRVMQSNGTWRYNRLLHYWSAAGMPWQAEDLTGSRGGPEILSDPDVVFRDGVDRVDIFAGGDYGHLLHYWWTDVAGWNQQNWDLTISTPGGLAFSGAFDGVYSVENGFQLHVYALNSRSELIHDGSDGFLWWCENLSSYLGGVMFGRPDVVVSQDNGQLRHDVFARSNFDSVLHYTWTAASGWRAFSVWAPAIKGDPVAIPDIRGQLVYDVFARSTSAGAGSLMHMWQLANPLTSWSLENLTTVTGGQPFAGRPNVPYPFPLQVFARSAEGHQLRYWWDGWSWRHQDLTLDYAGPLIAGDPVSLFGTGGPPQ
jgi:hypothetical protein